MSVMAKKRGFLKSLFGSKKAAKKKSRPKKAKHVKRKIKKVKIRKKVLKIKKHVKHVKIKKKALKVVKKPKKIVKPKKMVKKEKIVVKKQVKTVKKVIKEVKPLIERIPDEKAFLLLKKAKIPVAPFALVKKEKDLEKALKKTGFPCVMKTSSKHIIHRTEADGIIKNIKTNQEALEAFRKLMKIKNNEKVLIQKQLEGIETIAGIKDDPQFGLCLVFGLGGIYTEILKDVSIRACPIDLETAEEMIKEIKGNEILTGFRGKSVNLNSLKEALVNISKLAIKEKIKEMDINPLFCDEKGCQAADVRIIKK